MHRVLLTGVSGVGKSTITTAIAARDIRAMDLDAPGWSELAPVPAGELTGVGGGQDWVWNTARVRELLTSAGAAPLVVSGCSPNQGEFAALFAARIVLTAPPEVIVARLQSRTTNRFGRDAAERERVLQLQREIEPLLIRNATAVIDTSGPLAETVSRVLLAAGLQR